MTNSKINTNSEIAQLKKVVVHRPDGGVSYIPANKMHEWLYDDILDVYSTEKEYQAFQLLLLLFLSPEQLYKNNEFVIDKDGSIKIKDGKTLLETNPEKEGYYVNKSDDANVIDTQFLLQNIFKENYEATRELIASICVVEQVHPNRRDDLMAMLAEAKKDGQFYVEIVKTILSGKLEYKRNHKGELYKLNEAKARFIFPPIPNFLFTRDIGVSIGDHLLITKPKYDIRKREVLLTGFLAENYLCKDDHSKILRVSEDDEFFQIEEANQNDYRVSYEGGDIMMISDRHMLIGCSERTSPYAIQKLVHRLFWSKINTSHPDGIDYVSVIKIGEKRSQMHIDTVFSQIREDLWTVHSPLSEHWQANMKKKDWHSRDYNDELQQKSATQIAKEKDLNIFQFYLTEEGKELKNKYYNNTLSYEEQEEIKAKFKNLDFLLRADENGDYNSDKSNIYPKKPKGLCDLLSNISANEFGAKKEDVKFVLSGRGLTPFDTREQLTDACNLLTLRPGVSVGYDRNHKTALHFNEIVENDPTSDYPGFDDYIHQANMERFGENEKIDGTPMKLNHLIHVHDLYRFIAENNLSQSETIALRDSIKNALLLIPSNELSRARGGSHCMTMPIVRG